MKALLMNLTLKGGNISFDKSIMFEWLKGRHIEYKKVNAIEDYSLCFLPIEEGSFNSFIEIHGDMEHFDDCSDKEIFSLILEQTPSLKFNYADGSMISFFEFTSKENNIIITCNSVGDRAFWFFNQSMDDVKEIFKEPKHVTKFK